MENGKAGIKPNLERLIQRLILETESRVGLGAVFAGVGGMKKPPSIHVSAEEEVDCLLGVIGEKSK